jgi:Fe-S oxidoreductase
MGISGANMLIAETGTVVLVTNEGNAELVTSIPQIHVVLVGLEKLVPTFEVAILQLRLLAPSGTGQRQTAYVSWITGPTAPDQELHIVLLDNGRTAMRESVHYRDTLRCIRCGACSNVCPSYGVVGGHVFGYIYSGAIGLVNTPFHNGLENDVGPQSLCVSCNACQTVCPVDIPLPRQILDNRAWVAQEPGLPLPQRVTAEVWSHRRLFHAAARAGSLLQRPVQRGRFLEPPGMRRLTSWRKIPALANRPFRDLYATLDSRPIPGPLGRTLKGLTIAYFVQCLTDWLYPELGMAVVDVLHGLGAKVVFPEAQHCCGLPALDMGAIDQGRRMARQTIHTLERCPANYIVTGGTSCAVAMLHDYTHLFHEEPGWQIRALRQAERVLDFTSFLVQVARLPEGSLAAGPAVPATYHYFCQSYNVLGLRDEPLRLLSGVCGLDLKPLPEANVCCGFGGSVSINRPEMCAHILERKLDNLDSTGMQLLVTDNPGCIMHLRGGIAASGRRVEVKQTAEVVAERVRTLRR